MLYYKSFKKALVFMFLIGVFLSPFLYTFENEVNNDLNVHGIYGLAINTKQDLIDFAYEANAGEEDFSNALITLNSDIDMKGESLTPIGNYENPFNGVFNGLGNTIKNIDIEVVEEQGYIYTGLFGFIEDAQIGNLNVELDYEKQHENEDGDTALISGVVANSTNSEIANIDVKGSIDIKINAMDVYFGAVAARLDTQSQISRSRNSAKLDIDISAEEDAYIGGVVAKLDDSVIFESYNFSNRQSNFKIESENINIGGVLGSAESSLLQKIFSSTNTSIDIENSNANIGGVAGKVQGADYYDEYGLFNALIYSDKRLEIDIDNTDQQVYKGGVFGKAIDTQAQQIYSIYRKDIEDAQVGALAGDAQEFHLSNSFYLYDDEVQQKFANYDDATQTQDVSEVSNEDRSMDMFEDNGLDWNIAPESEKDDVKQADWVFTSNQPIIKNLGYTTLITEIEGEGMSSHEGITVTPRQLSQTYNILAESGHEITKIRVNDREYTEVEGQTMIEDLTVNLDPWQENEVTIYINEIPFYRTREFYIFMGLGGIVLLMVVGTFIINYLYDKKQKRKIENKKDGIKKTGVDKKGQD